MFNLLKMKNMSRFHNRNFELLEPYEGKLSRTVLRGERDSNIPDLPDHTINVLRKLGYVIAWVKGLDNMVSQYVTVALVSSRQLGV